METPNFIPAEQDLRASLDYFYLRSEGIAHAQALSGETWTDYNQHDPGVTILEQLCYALTDLGYRTNFNIKELLQVDNQLDNGQAFYDASDIFTCAPLTPTDYRILLIDRIDGVQNAWLEPLTSNIDGINGLYRVLLQLAGGISPEEQEYIRTEVRQLLNANRNLGEDFESIDFLTPQPIRLEAVLDISPDVMGEQLAAQLYSRLTDYFSPHVKLYNLEELFEMGYSAEEIYAGPAPLNGFILADDLRSLPQEIYVSKLIEMLSADNNVSKVRHVKVFKNGVPVDGDVIVMDRDSYPILELNFETDNKDSKREYVEDMSLQFVRNGLQYPLNRSMVQQLYYSLRSNYKRAYQHADLYHPERNPNAATTADIKDYISVQHHFPLNYGIGIQGIPSAERSPRRLAQAQQLKGYLLLFEQILANHLAQLASAKDLFSLQRTLKETYFNQFPSDIPGIGDLLSHATPSDFQLALSKILNPRDNFIARRNRFLDHILARFGEHFFTDFAVKNGLLDGLPDADEQADLMLIERKLDLLKQIVPLSRDRAKGIDIAHSFWLSDNIAPFQRKVSILLNLPMRSARPLSEIAGLGTLKHEELSPQEVNIFQRKTTRRVSGEDSQYQIVTPKTTTTTTGKFVFASMSSTLFYDLLEHGAQANNYRIFNERSTKSWHLIFRNPVDKQEIKVYEADSKQGVNQGLDYIVKYFQKMSAESEGFHAVEHILLRPQSSSSHAFNLLDDRDSVLLRSGRSADKDTIYQMGDDLLVRGCKRENYRLEEKDDSWSLVLLDLKGEVIAKNAESFDTEEEAQLHLEDVVDYLNSLRKGNTPISSRLEIYTEQQNGEIDFHYSNRLSLVMPNWSPRFRSADFRQLFQKVVNSCLPAHLVADFYWLDLPQLKQFETHYAKWAVLRVSTNPSQTELDQLAATILEFLKTCKPSE